MKATGVLFSMILLLAMPGGAAGQHLNLGGFMDSYHAVRLQEPYDFMSSRSRFRAEIRGEKDRSGFFVSLNANHHNLLPERTFIELRELYLEYAGQNWDLRAGRQIIIWGVADGMKITDIISAMDLTEFLAREYDDIRMPVDALKFRAFRNNFKVEMVFIPVFNASVIPVSPENPWSVLPASTDGPVVVLGEAVKPENRLSNSEIGGRASFYFSGFDVSVASLYTWNKFPVFRNELTSGMDTLAMHPEHHRLTMVGIDLSKPLGSLVIRGEAGYFSGEHFPTEMEGKASMLVRKPVIRFLAGIDWYPGSGWTLTGQYAHTCILNFENDLDCNAHTFLATLGISKKLLNSTLSLSTFGYVDLTNLGFFNRTGLDYSLSDQIHLCLGIDLFAGEGGMFGTYADNSEIWIKVKYSF